MKLVKTERQLIDYMWGKYPHDNQLEIREAMLETFKFLTGNHDHDQKIKDEIKASIDEINS